MAEGHVCGGIISRKFLKFETWKCYFLHSEHPKDKKLLTIIRGGGAKCDFVGGTRGNWGAFAPPACMLKKALLLTCSSYSLVSILD
jgi:hypothetical protein